MPSSPRWPCDSPRRRPRCPRRPALASKSSVAKLLIVVMPAMFAASRAPSAADARAHVRVQAAARAAESRTRRCTMIGIGVNASSAISGETTKNTAPTATRRGRHLNQIVRAAVEEALELIDVVVQDRHEVAGAAILEVREIELLHVAVRVDPQRVLQVLREISPRHHVEVLEHRLEHPDRERERRPRARAATCGCSMPSVARNESCRRTTTSIAMPIRISGITSNSLFRIEYAVASTMRARKRRA